MLIEEISRHQQTLAKQQPDPDTTGVFRRMCTVQGVAADTKRLWGPKYRRSSLDKIDTL